MAVEGSVLSVVLLGEAASGGRAALFELETSLDAAPDEAARGCVVDGPTGGWPPQKPEPLAVVDAGERLLMPLRRGCYILRVALPWGSAVKARCAPAALACERLRTAMKPPMGCGDTSAGTLPVPAPLPAIGDAGSGTGVRTPPSLRNPSLQRPLRRLSLRRLSLRRLSLRRSTNPTCPTAASPSAVAQTFFSSVS